MKKYFTLLFVLVGLLAFAIGCSKEFTSGAEYNFDETQTKDIVLRVWLDDTDGLLMDEIIPAFEKANPGIVVEFQHMATVDAREKLKTYGNSGNGADVFQFPHDHMAQAILDDLVYVLPDAMKERLTETVLPVAMDIATSCYDETTGSFECAAGAQKKLFAVPMTIESVVIYYNKALVTSEMLPASFEDFIADAKEYQAKVENKGKWYFNTSSHWADAYFLQFAYGAFGWTPFGAQLNDASEVGFADPESVAAIKWFINELKPVVTGSGTHNSVAGTTLFEEGNLPFLLSGPWAVPGFEKAGIDYGAITIPSIQGKKTTTFAGAQMLAVYKYSKNAEAAMKFVEYMTTVEAAEILNRTSGDCPALKQDIIDGIERIKNNVALQVMLEQLKTSVPMPTIPEVTYYWGPAETMMKNIWNAQGVIEDEVVLAEKSYRATRDLAS